MNELAFKFYSIIKNEDVPPYLGEDFLVCADGLGGSGSVVHEIDREKHPELKDELFESAFGDIGREELAFCADYIDSLLSEMADEKSDTSAMWGSRIATVRFIYVLTKKPEGMADISSEEQRREISKFVHKGLVKVKKDFDLDVGKVSGMLPLPTTMCAMRYEDKGDYVLAESIWAGDSRCYIITPEGLRCASIDDEASNGGITNLFDALDDTVTTLNYRKFEIKKPCVLLTASDGIFDTFKPNVTFSFDPENLGVEKEILSHIMKASSPSEAGTLLHDCYNKDHRGDDSTLCFVPIGFKDFEDVKATLKPRADKICQLYKDYQDKSSQLFSLSINEDDIASYVLQRTRDKLPKIASLIAEAYSTGSADPVITDELLALIEERRASIASSLRTKRSGALIASIDAFGAKLLENPRLAIISKKSAGECVFNSSASLKIIGDLSSRAHDLLKKQETLEARREAYEAQLPELKKVGKELKLNCRTLADELLELDTDTSKWLKKKELFNLLLFALRGICDDELRAIPKIKGISDTYSALIAGSNEIIKDTLNLKGKLEYAETQVALAKRSYKHALDTLLAFLKASRAHIEANLTPEAIRAYSLTTEVSEAEVRGLLASELPSVLSSAENTERVAQIIKKALQGALNSTSVIESQYNSARLARFKDYYRSMTSPREKIEALDAQIKAVIAEYALKD